MPARLIGEKENTGGKIEFLLLKRIEGDKWECLAKPGKRAKIGTIFTFGEYGYADDQANTTGGLMLSFTAFEK